MGYPDTFKGFMVKNKEAWSDFTLEEFKPKPFEDYDVDIKIQACGICGSDCHTLRSGWFPTNYPVCVGHEIVGEVVRVGSKVTEFKVGDRAGIGAAVNSCHDCETCKEGKENYCMKGVQTYNGVYPDGSKSYGGYSNYVRGNEQFVFKIPKELETNIVAPMLCGGLTMFSPLLQKGCGPGKTVGIVGIGGLGHFGIMFAKAMGAKVVAISRSSSKKADVMKMGADEFWATGEEKDWDTKYARKLDIVICTANASKEFELGKYFKLLKVHGDFVQVGVPDGPLPQLMPFDIIMSGISFGGSAIGSKKEVYKMLDIAVKSKVKSWIQEIPISAKGCHEGVEKQEKSDVRYRFVLTGYDKAFD